MLSKKLIIAMMFILMLAAGSAQAGGDAAKGAELAADCADCHGDDGLGDEDVPAIAGMAADEQLKELMAFKSGARVDEDMMYAVEDFNEQALADIAAYYATLPGK
jgi:cytochrome c553